MESQTIFLNQILSRQTKPAFRMLAKIIELCPKSLWAQRNIDPPIWQQIYHILYALDYWFSHSKASFKQPVFEDDVNPVLGEESKGFIEQSEMIEYLKYVKKSLMIIYRTSILKMFLAHRPFIQNGQTWM
jgi:hypothetical protein